MKKVVVAEASPTIKSVADSLLRQNGYDVVCTSDGLQAWEVISSEKPDLVLAGLGLSGMSGLELCLQVVSDRITGGIPVVLMIGAKDPVSEEQILASGARGKLKKPFSPKDLIDIVNKLAGQVVEAPRPVAPMQGAATPGLTKFAAQISSTQHLHSKPESYNLEWLDLNKNQSTKSIPKVASFDLTGEEQSLIIDDDQYGLSTPIPIEEEKPNEAHKDEDYDWFVGEIKKEIDGKPKPEKLAESEKMSAIFNSPPSSGLRFDDIQPTISAGPSSPKNFPEPENFFPPPKITQASTPGESPGQAGRRNLSDEEIALLADRVAMKLAIHIAARVDKAQIIEAVRQVLKS